MRVTDKELNLLLPSQSALLCRIIFITFDLKLSAIGTELVLESVFPLFACLRQTMLDGVIKNQYHS